MKKGLVSKELFKELCEKGGVKEADTLRRYCIELELAVNLDDGNLFIPALASDKEVHWQNFVAYFYLSLFVIGAWKIFI